MTFSKEFILIQTVYLVYDVFDHLCGVGDVFYDHARYRRQRRNNHDGDDGGVS